MIVSYLKLLINTCIHLFEKHNNFLKISYDASFKSFDLISTIHMFFLFTQLSYQKNKSMFENTNLQKYLPNERDDDCLMNDPICSSLSSIR